MDGSTCELERAPNWVTIALRSPEILCLRLWIVDADAPDTHHVTSREWITTEEAASILGRTAHTVGYLARTGQLPSKSNGCGLLVKANAVRERADDAGLWVSQLRAAELVRCSATTILRAVQRGVITRRPPASRAQPTLSRASVDDFARTWVAERKLAEFLRPERAAWPA